VKKKEHISKLYGRLSDLFNECATLTLVFGILDKTMDSKWGFPGWSFVGYIGGVCLALFLIGFLGFELRRDKRS
jgi:hypothetical protein